MNLPEIRITSVFGRPVESGTPLYKGLRLFGLTPRQPSPKEKAIERRQKIVEASRSEIDIPNALRTREEIKIRWDDGASDYYRDRDRLSRTKIARREKRLRGIGYYDLLQKMASEKVKNKPEGKKDCVV